MSYQQTGGMSRREFLGGLTLVGTAGLLGLHPEPVAAPPPPETTKIRPIKIDGICIAPQYVAEELLRGEGCTEVQYLQTAAGIAGARALASGEVDITLNCAAPFIIRADAGDPIAMLAGAHVGCFELFGTERVRAIRNLKGKMAAVEALDSSQHVFLSSMAAYVGLDPSKDSTWVISPSPEAVQLLATGKIDAFLGFPPYPQELRAKQIGHVVVNSWPALQRHLSPAGPKRAHTRDNAAPAQPVRLRPRPAAVRSEG